MRKFYLLLAGLAAIVFATPATAQMPGQLCTATSATLGNCGVVLGVNTLVRITDGLLASNACTGGTDEMVCLCEGVTCVPAVDDTGLGALTGTTSNTFTVDSDADGTNTAAFVFGEFGESIINSLDDQFDFTRDDGGIVTITASDNDNNAQLTVASGGTGALVLGSVNDGSITAAANGDILIGVEETDSIVIRGILAEIDPSTTGTTTLDFKDFDGAVDDVNASITMNCTTTTDTNEDCDYSVAVQEAGAIGTRLSIDGDGDTIFAPERPDGGNGNGLTTNPQRRVNGVPKIAGFSLGTGNDGSETINVDFGDDETPDTEWTQTANITTSDEATIIRMGTGSLELLVGAAPADGNGADCALTTGNQDWTDDASFGMWMRCDELTDATMWVLEIHDTGPVTTELVIPAVPVADHWTWVEVDVSGLANASKDAIDTIAIDLTAAGAAAMDTQTCWFDYMFKWDDAEELAMNMDIYEDGILSMFSIITATANNRTPILEVEGTDYLVHYETGNDFIVPISDLSADSLWGMAAEE